MSPPERSIDQEGPCPCGAGRYELLRLEQTHMYGGIDFYATLKCPKCEAGYVLKHERHQGLWYESKEDINAHRERWDRCVRLKRALAADKLQPLAARLEKIARDRGHQNQHWFAALAPILGLPDPEQFRAEIRSVGSFVAWVGQYVKPSNAVRLSAALGVLDSDLERRIAEVAEADAAIGKVRQIPVRSGHSA
jgi:hypothetical protein